VGKLIDQVRWDRWPSNVAVAVTMALIMGACTSGRGSAERWSLDSAEVTVNAPFSCVEVGCAGEGIDTAAGAFWSEAEDVLFPAGLFGIELVRAYRSDRQAVGWFGRGWSTIYETTLAVDDNGMVIDAPLGLTPLWSPEAPAGWTIAGAPTVSQVDGGYALTWPTGEQWSFGDDGALESLESPYSAAVTIERAGSEIKLTSTQGVTVTLNLDGGRVVAAVTSDGRRVDYAYAGELLTGVSAPGIEVGYRYDGSQRLKEIAAPAGTTTVAYADGRVATQRTADGQRFTFTYDGATTRVESSGPDATYEHDDTGRLVRLAYGNRDVLVQEFDRGGRLVARTEYASPGDQVVSSIERTYVDGRVVAESVNGATTTYRYDSSGRVTEIAGPVSATFEYEDDEPLPVSVTTPATGRSSITYRDGFVVAVTDATGVTAITTRDALGNPTGTGNTPDALWRYEFDAEGNITTTTSPSGRTWTAQWGPRALLRSERDPLGRTISYSYDGAGRLIRETRPAGRITEWVYNDVGQLVAVTEPGDLTTRYEYDTAGRTATIVLPGDRTWRLTYEDRADGSQVITTTAPDGTATITTLDSAGREVERSSVEPDGAEAETVANTYDFDRLTEVTVRRGQSRLVTTTVYDTSGRVVAVESTLDGTVTRSDSYEYAADRVIAARSGDEAATYSYDDAGRLTEVSSGDDTWTASYRDGQIVATRHNDDTTQIERDVDGRPIQFVGTTGVTTAWRYDDADRPIRRAVGQAVAEFRWNDADQLISYQAPTSATWSWLYDEAGRLTGASEPGGATTTYEYEFGSVRRIRASGGGHDRNDEYSYDARGLLRTADTSDGKYQYVYDAAGRIVAIDGPRENDDESWVLDAAGQVVEVTSNDRTYSIAYTDTGQIDEIVGPNDEFLDAQWHSSNLASVQVDGHDPLRITADQQGRLTSIAWDDDTIIDIEWKESESFSLRQRDTDDSFDYTVSDGRLTRFEGNGTTYTASVGTGGFLEALSLISDDVDGIVKFDATGRPATLTSADHTSTITYDQAGRVSSVLTTRPGDEPEQTTVTYDDGRSIDGDADLVNALFDEMGVLKQSLPNTLRNPLSAAAESTALQRALLIDGTEALLLAEPDPFTQVESALTASTPQLTAPIGVRDRQRMAQQLVVAEVGRLAPTVAINEGLTVQVPIINPDNGELIDYNPFVDATPSGLALGVLAQQAGGGGSLFERAVDRLGDIVGGIVSFSADIARFVVTNPIVRPIVGAMFAVAAAASCAPPGSVTCVPLTAIGVGFLVGDALSALMTAVPAVAQSCPDGEVARCGLNLAYTAFAGLEFYYAIPVGLALVRVGRAGLTVFTTRGAGYAKAIGDYGEARSGLREALIGSRTVARNQRVCVGAGSAVECAHPDLTVVRLKDRLLHRNNLTYIESKYGPGARLTPAQQRVYPCLGPRVIVHHWKPGSAVPVAAHGLSCPL
jgi:YD repeat-containing protein